MTTHSPQSVRPGHGLTVADAMDPCDHRIADDSSVDQADGVLRGAHLDYLLVLDHDGRCG